MNEINEQMNSTTHTATAEEIDNGVKEESISLGKFKDVKSLLSAYNSLQAEFTKRCQRLKELEDEIAVDKANAPTKTDDQSLAENNNPTSIQPNAGEDVLKEYLKGIISAKPRVAVLNNTGMGLKTPSEKPKNLSEAGKLAKEMFTKPKV